MLPSCLTTSNQIPWEARPSHNEDLLTLGGASRIFSTVGSNTDGSVPTS